MEHTRAASLHYYGVGASIHFLGVDCFLGAVRPPFLHVDTTGLPCAAFRVETVEPCNFTLALLTSPTLW